MEVDLVSVEVCVEGGAVGVVHADGALALEHARAVRHQPWTKTDEAKGGMREGNEKRPGRVAQGFATVRKHARYKLCGTGRGPQRTSNVRYMRWASDSQLSAKRAIDVGLAVSSTWVGVAEVCGSEGEAASGRPHLACAASVGGW